MTLRLPKSRPTTRPNTPRAKALERRLVRLALAASLALGLTGSVALADPYPGQTAGWVAVGTNGTLGEIQPTTYTEPVAEATGTTLRWRAPRQAASTIGSQTNAPKSARRQQAAIKSKPTFDPDLVPTTAEEPVADRYDWGAMGLEADSAPSAKRRVAALSRTIRQADAEQPVFSKEELPADEPGSLPELSPSDDEHDKQPSRMRRTSQKQDSGPQGVPSLSDLIAQSPQSLEVDCDIERKKLKPINAITNKINPEPGIFPPECDLGNPPYRPRAYTQMCYTWKASNLCHKPLYFEDVDLERYGHQWPTPLQPFISAAHFFVSFAILPYKMGIDTPNECVYSLGYYRPGSCAPYHINGFPLSARGALFQATEVLALVYILP